MYTGKMASSCKWLYSLDMYACLFVYYLFKHGTSKAFGLFISRRNYIFTIIWFQTHYSNNAKFWRLDIFVLFVLFVFSFRLSHFGFWFLGNILENGHHTSVPCPLLWGVNFLKSCLKFKSLKEISWTKNNDHNYSEAPCIFLSSY